MKISSEKCASLEDSPEEGEIFSDDLEDISDVSLSLPTHKSGKFHYHSDNLHDLSLSSVSDFEETTLKVKNQRKRKKCFSHKVDRQKKHRKKPPDSNSSDNDSLEACRLKLQLKATVQLDSKDVISRNSLKTRLRAMVNNTGRDSDATDNNLSPNIMTVNSTPDPSITLIDLMAHDTSSAESIQENIDNNLNSSKDDLDNELIQLRLEALKTAIQNKYPNGAKSRKARNNEGSKENISNNCETHNDTLGNIPHVSHDANSNLEHKSTNPPEEDEDVDVLRALLLASMSRKISEIECALPTSSYPMTQQKINTISNGIENNRYKRTNNVRAIVRRSISQEKVALKPLVTTTVKPLIICVNSNSDSDSDWELSSGSPGKSPKKVENVPEVHAVISSTEVDSTVNKTETTFENTIERFLKEERAKVEHLKATEPVPSKKTAEIPNKNAVAAASSNTTATAPKPKPKLAVTAPSKTKITATSRQIEKISFNNKVLGTSKLDKSVLNFLPATKREEYRKLQDLLRQKNAQRRKHLTEKLENKSKFSAPQVPKTVIKQLQIQTTAVKIDDKNQQSCAVVPELNNVKNVETKDCVQPVSPIKTETKREIRDQSTQTEEFGGVQLSPKTEARLNEFRSQELTAAERSKEKRRQTQHMRNILKQLQVQSNGRLQMGDKYKCLRPLIKNLNGVIKEQKDCELEVEKLINQVTEVRKKQELLHNNLLDSIKQLEEKKTNIDLSMSNHSRLELIGSSSNELQSTNNANICCNIISSLQQDISGSIEDNNSQNSLVGDLKCADNQDSIIDPNDIDQIIKKTQKQIARNECSEQFERRTPQRNKYISPLDCMSRWTYLEDTRVVLCG
ncbi:uncharacterized protein LOC109545093 isoform X2 [Dendroctonus ponderosae]|uniref:uncharacterized protein LOC109545093 isoform X2 n=1 Tax=Dendroctonus ponderosae TaxID=77166 RepID=UPI0020358157|nr:uncharacterized protein LOC109545093 isoform X2 [Dendroctonus ponderosae]